MPFSFSGLNFAGAVTAQAVFPRPPEFYLWSWGQNNTGQLGLNTSGTDYSSPKQIGSLADWQSTSSGFTHSLAVKTDGTMWSWGAASSGQLGLGIASGRSSPTQIGSLTNWSTTGAGREHSLAVKTDGTLWVWGSGGSGRLGLGNTTAYSSPVQVGALTNWLNVSAGYSFTIAKQQ